MSYHLNDDLIPKTKRRLVRFWVVFAHLLIIGGPLMWALWVYKPIEKITSIQVTTTPNPAQKQGPLEQPQTAPPPEAPELPTPPAPPPEPEPQPEPTPEPIPEPMPEPEPAPAPPKKEVKPTPVKKIEPKKAPKKEIKKEPKKNTPLKRPPLPPKVAPDKPLKRPPLPTKNKPLKRPPKPTTPSGWKRVDNPSDLTPKVASNTVKNSPFEQAKSPTPMDLPPLNLPIENVATAGENSDYLMTLLHPYVASRFDPLCPKRMELNKKEPTVDVQISINADGSYSWKLLRNSGEPTMDQAVRTLMVTMRRVPRKPKGPFPYVTTITFTVEK